MEQAHEIVHYDLWPLSWWEYPHTWIALLGVGIVLWVLYMLYGRYRVQHALPRSVAARIVYQLKLLERLDFQASQDRRYACVLLMQMTRECAYHSFGIVHMVMTDEEFVQAVHARELPESFKELLDAVHTESFRVKFADAELTAERALQLLQQATAYFEAVVAHERSHKAP